MPSSPVARIEDGEPPESDAERPFRAVAAAGVSDVAPEALYRLLVESVQDYAIFALDRNGYVLSWNAGAERINGYTAEEIVGQHFSVFYPPEKIAEEHPAFELREAARTGRFEEQGWRLRKGGSPFWANVLITALRDEQGALCGFAKVTRDLTERRAAEERALEDARRVGAEEARRREAEALAHELTALTDRLQEQAVELEAANKTKRVFLASMSHELRTPLNAIGGYAELLAAEVRGPVNDAQRHDIERIIRAQKHLLGLIDDILRFTRGEAGRLRPEIGPVLLRDVVESVRAAIASEAEAKGIALDVSAIEPDVAALADRSKLAQILTHLLTNAVTFTDPGGTVSVRCAVSNETAVVSVRDTGIGIAADQHEAIFEPFVQVDRSFSSRHEGVGLGLPISRDVARAMGGDITVSSAVGAGSTFTLTLPLAPPRAIA